MTRDNGAHFFRTDLQVHTPRDGGWKGARPKSDVDRREFASKFVAHCRSVGLNAVAVTDHHDLAFVPYIRAAANTETDASGSLLPEADRLVVFPGIELTLAVPCQAIVVLDADFPDDRLSLVLEALAIDPADPADEVAAATTPLEHLTSLEAVYSTLNQREWLRGRFIVLPNVTDSGHKTLMRPGMHAKYKAMPCVGGYLDGPVTKIGTGNQGIFAGQNKSYGYKPLTVFQTSDARNANFAKLGEPSTWIKWAAPTAEAIRQACLAPESRVSHDDPALPTVFVSRLVVSNSKFLGPVDVYWNRQYNALIGGRGTGKSTLLDYVRWALCDQPPTSDDLEELANPAQRRRRLVEQTLAPFAAVVDVHFTVNGVEHVVRRSAGSGELLLKVSDDDFAPAREADIQALLPVHAYSQKQLSSVAVRVEELRRFIVAPIRQALEGVDAAISETAGRFRENYARRERARALDASISQLKVSEESLSKQASNLRGSLKGLSAEDQALLGRRQSVDAVRETVTRWKQDLEALSGSAGLQLEDLAQAREGQANDTLPDVALSEHGERLRAATAEALAAAERAMKAASDALTSALHPDSARSQAEKTVTGELARFDDEYRAVTARSSAHKASLQTLADLEARRTEVATMLAEQTRERQALGEPDALHAELQAKLLELYSSRSERLALQCEALTELSDGLLRATLERGRGFKQADERLRQMISGSGVRGARIDGVFAALASESSPLHSWHNLVNDLELLLRLDPDEELTSERTPTLTRLGLPLADQKRIAERITPDSWLDLALTRLSDSPVFEYYARESEYIDFASASAGQQATALLRVLLAQGGMPLIIDQPEEDLDSQVVQDVVERLWKSKRDRQIIFASHNANLVVNGDAELVVVCDHRGPGDQAAGSIRLQGAIDVPEVRTAITHTMEGGEKAFKLRKEKYGF